jgi:hypothetical protein
MALNAVESGKECGWRVEEQIEMPGISINHLMKGKNKA